jgi:hypothetical protein
MWRDRLRAVFFVEAQIIILPTTWALLFDRLTYDEPDENHKVVPTAQKIFQDTSCFFCLSGYF